MSELRVWDLVTGRCIQVLGIDSGIKTMSVTSDGRRVILATLAETLEVWDLEKIIRYVKPSGGHSDLVEAAKVMPEEAETITESEYKMFRVTCPGTGRPIRTLEGHDERVNAMSMTPDGRTAVKACYDHTLRVWDLETGRCIQTFDFDTLNWPTSIL
jgi:WD40 repeat protein